MLIELATKNRLIQIMIKHINRRLKINYYKIVIPVSIVLILGLSMPFMINHIVKRSFIVEDPIINFQLTALYCSIAIFAIIFTQYLNDPEKMKQEIKYIFYTYNFIDDSYKYVMKKYNSAKPVYRYFFKPKYSIAELDNIVANLIIVSVFHFYYTNIDSYNYNDNPIRYISNESLCKLFENKEFKEFYSILFFNPKKKDKQTCYEALVVAVLDSVIHELYKKPWFAEYYNPDKLSNMIEFILNQWCYIAIQYNLNGKFNIEKSK